MATYYVSTTGNDSNTGTEAAPWKTIAKAATAAAAGDTVIINSGTYDETVTFSKSGAAGNPITFIGSGSPVIRGNVTTKGSYLVIDGFTISPPSAGGYGAVTLAGQHNILQNCLVTNYGARASDQATAIIFDTSGAYNTVQGCTIRDLNDIDVFHVFGHDQIILNNYVTNIQTVNYNLNHTDFIQSYAWSGSSAYNIIVNGNLVTNSSAQLGNTETDGNPALHDWTFENNIFANVSGALFSGIPNTRFYNNVFYQVGSSQGYAVRSL